MSFLKLETKIGSLSIRFYKQVYMTDTAHPAKRQPLAKNRPLFFMPTEEERAMVERIAEEEERTLTAVVRRIFRAGVAAQGIASGNSTPTA